MREISCGLTTCPRPGASYLSTTLKSLKRAGFDKPLIGADGGAATPPGYPVIQQAERIGAFKNFKAVLRRLSDARTDAGGYLIAQDDVIVAGGLRDYLEATEWDDDVGVISPYCAAANHQPGTGWNDLKDPSGHNAFGALCILLPRRHALDFLCSGIGGDSRHLTDFWLGDFCKSRGLKYSVHSPSLVKHVGTVSAINARRKVHSAQERYRNCAVFMAQCPE